MRALVCLGLVATVSVPVFAQKTFPEIVSVTTLSVGHQQVALPKVRLPNGAICQSYLASFEHVKGSNETRYALKEICDKPADSKNNASQDAPQPRAVSSMYLYQNENITYQASVFTTNFE